MPCVIEIAREPRTLFTHRHRFADSDEPWVTNPRKPSMRLVADDNGARHFYQTTSRTDRRLGRADAWKRLVSASIGTLALLLSPSQVRATPNGRRSRREARKRPSRRGPRGVVARGPDARWTRRVCAGATGARRPAAPARREARGAPPARGARGARGDSSRRGRTRVDGSTAWAHAPAAAGVASGYANAHDARVARAASAPAGAGTRARRPLGALSRRAGAPRGEGVMAELEASEGASARRLDGEGGAEASGGGQLVGAEAPRRRLPMAPPSARASTTPGPRAPRRTATTTPTPSRRPRRRLFRRVARAGSELAPRRRADDALDPLARTGAMRAAMIAAQAAARPPHPRDPTSGTRRRTTPRGPRVRDADASAASSSSPSPPAARALRRRGARRRRRVLLRLVPGSSQKLRERVAADRERVDAEVAALRERLAKERAAEPPRRRRRRRARRRRRRTPRASTPRRRRARWRRRRRRRRSAERRTPRRGRGGASRRRRRA